MELVGGSLSDEALVARLAVGDTSRFSTLVERHRQRLYAVLVRVTGRPQEADDLFQETWIRVARRAVTFDPSRSFASWVARIATNVAIDWMRTNAAKPRPEADAASEEQPSTSLGADAELHRRSELTRISAAMAELPNRCAK